MSLAIVLCAAQFMILQQMRAAFTRDHALLYFGSPLGLLLGPVLYVLCRRGKKSHRRFTLDLVLAAVILMIFSAMILSIGQALSSSSEVLGWLILISPSLGEAVGLLFVEWLLRKARSCS